MLLRIQITELTRFEFRMFKNNERTSIFAYREFFNNVFNMAIILGGLLIFLPATAEFEDGLLNRDGYAPLAMTVAVIGIITSLISVYGTRKDRPLQSRYANDSQTRWTDTFKQISVALKVKPFVWFSLAYSTIVILYGATSAQGFYHLTYVGQFSQGAKSLVTIAPLLTLIPCVILTSYLAKKIEKKPTALILGLYLSGCIWSVSSFQTHCLLWGHSPI